MVWDWVTKKHSGLLEIDVVQIVRKPLKLLLSCHVLSVANLYISPLYKSPIGKIKS
jgi:hypothetical protein